ncbi:MAG: hypothetical protein CVU44_17295 [Chloroflexi bacterium HGW-Chloroflexi-6]|nr:MAG: hypothetical protein CVU44_17295 [Chloroflexi bacterium HGW-Chloroflexi-6]
MAVFFAVYIEFEKNKYETHNDLLRAVQNGYIHEIAKNTGLIYPQDESFLPSDQGVRFENDLEKISKWFFKETHKVIKPVILFDDIHRGIDSTCLSKSFSIIRPLVANQKSIVILCGEMPLDKEFRNDVSVLRNLVSEQIELPPLSIEDIKQILSIVEDNDWEVENGVDTTLYEITKGHPYRIHYYLLEALRSEGKLTAKMLRSIDSNRAIKAFLGNVLKEEKTIKKNEENSMKTILFLAADPTDATRLRLGEEQREIQNKIQMGKFRENFIFQSRTSVRSEDVSQALLDIEPKIVHFSGHGTQDGELCFEDVAGKVHAVEPLALANLFEQFKDQIECIVLNACFSEPQAKAIAKNIPYLIGMKKEIGDKPAIAFSIGFYQAVAAGKSIEQAYNLGCAQMGIQHGIKQGEIPILIKQK